MNVPAAATPAAVHSIADYLNDFDSPIDGMQAKLEKVDRFGAR